MPSEKYVGRMVCVNDEEGNGHLMAHADENGPIYDDEGKCILREIAYDPDTGGYIYVESGSLSHNERFHERFVGLQTTSEPLYDGNGNLVQGDLHHFMPLPDDPHFLEGAFDPETGKVTHTKLTFHDDDDNTRTGHTESVKRNA